MFSTTSINEEEKEGEEKRTIVCRKIAIYYGKMGKIYGNAKIFRKLLFCVLHKV